MRYFFIVCGELVGPWPCEGPRAGPGQGPKVGPVAESVDFRRAGCCWHGALTAEMPGMLLMEKP